MAVSASVMLDRIDDAISAVMLGGQEYTIGDRTFKRGDLDKLRKMRSYYAALVRRESDSTGGVHHADFGDHTGSPNNDFRNRRIY